jgi:hypothetical protein
MKPCFIETPKLLGWGREFGKTNFGAFGEFLADLSVPNFVQ